MGLASGAQPDGVAHACNPRGRGKEENQEFMVTLGFLAVSRLAELCKILSENNSKKKGKKKETRNRPPCWGTRVGAASVGGKAERMGTDAGGWGASEPAQRLCQGLLFS